MPPSMNYQPWIFAFNVFQFLLSSGLGIYVWWTNKEKVTNTRFEAQDKRITKIESDLQHPSCTRHQVLEEKLSSSNQTMNARLDALHGDIRELTGSVKGLNRAVDLMNEYLINKSKG
jgi:hypothetical protein